MKNIAGHIKIGKQEDAHEFLIYFLEAMRISSLKYAQTFKCSDIKILDEDNLIHKVFGGSIISSVTCNVCRIPSNKIDEFVDISLVYLILIKDINSYTNNSLIKCLSNFCKPELLQGSNKYNCERCHQYNEAIKRMSFKKCKNV